LDSGVKTIRWDREKAPRNEGNISDRTILKGRQTYNWKEGVGEMTGRENHEEEAIPVVPDKRASMIVLRTCSSSSADLICRGRRVLEKRNENQQG
jgi:hypothetical protein